ncbi:MAG: c-type cytochrome [Maritimibacter harenae]
MAIKILALAAAVCTVATGAVAQNTAGEEEFMVACAGCHGESAKGDGPLAGLLKIDTPDLTRMTERNGGEFPFEYAVWMIDGREMIRMHGSTDMPVWGDRFMASAAGSEKSPIVQELMAHGRILSLVYYLESIQE